MKEKIEQAAAKYLEAAQLLREARTEASGGGQENDRLVQELNGRVNEAVSMNKTLLDFIKQNLSK